MSRAVPAPAVILLVAAATTLAVGLLDGRAWGAYVIGAVLSLALWVMLFCGSFASTPKGVVAPGVYAVAAAVAVVLGAVLVGLTDNSGFWSVGFILAGTVLPATSAALRDRDGA